MMTSVWVRNLYQKTVWSPLNTATIPPRFQIIYTLVLPFKYLLISAYGLMSAGAPITSIDLVFGDVYGDIWSISVAVSGFAAAIGVMFYSRFIALEQWALAFMITLMLAYVGCIATAAIVQAESFRFLSLMLVLIFIPMPLWRLLDIVRELRPARHV